MTHHPEIVPTDDFTDFLRLRGVETGADKSAARRDIGGVGSVLERAWRAGRASASDLAAMACEYYELPRADFEAVSDLRPQLDGLSLQYRTHPA